MRLKKYCFSLIFLELQQRKCAVCLVAHCAKKMRVFLGHRLRYRGEIKAHKTSKDAESNEFSFTSYKDSVGSSRKKKLAIIILTSFIKRIVLGVKKKKKNDVYRALRL